MIAMSDTNVNDDEPTRVPEEKRATEYLANERTFLAWIRTSIAVISAGIVISRLAIWFHYLTPASKDAPAHNSFSFIVGLAMIVLGGLVSLLAVWRYHVVNTAIDEGTVKPDRGLVVLVTFLVVLLAVSVVAFMLLSE
jgi:putative membrane protein